VRGEAESTIRRVYQATLVGDGAIAQGPGAVAAGARGVAIGGSLQGGVIITGDGSVVGDGSSSQVSKKSSS